MVLGHGSRTEHSQLKESYSGNIALLQGHLEGGTKNREKKGGLASAENLRGQGPGLYDLGKSLASLGLC